MIKIRPSCIGLIVVGFLVFASYIGAPAVTRAQSPSQTPDDGLLRALYSSNISEARKQLENGADANATDSRGFSPLVCAAFMDDVYTEKLLIAKGAKVNYQAASNGLSPLMEAAATASPDFVALLLDNGAKPDLAAPSGSTALNEALAEKRYLTASLLLQRGADPNIVVKGIPLVFFYIVNKDVTALQLLVKYKVRLTDKLANKTPEEVAGSLKLDVVSEVLRSKASSIVLPPLSNQSHRMQDGGVVLQSVGKITSIDGGRLILNGTNLYVITSDTTFLKKAAGAAPLDPATLQVAKAEDMLAFDTVTIKSPVGSNKIISISEGPLIVANGIAQ